MRQFFISFYYLTIHTYNKLLKKLLSKRINLYFHLAVETSTDFNWNLYDQKYCCTQI